MKIAFKDKALSDLYENGKTEDRKYKKICRNIRLIEGYQRAVSIMYDVESTEELKYQKEAKSSVRIVNGMLERLLFTETDDGIEVELLEIDSTHYGNK